jgi:hypothetical protein
MSWLKKLAVGAVFREVVQGVTLNRRDQSTLLSEFRAKVLDFPASEVDLIHERESAKGFRLDATHPPTQYRIQFVADRTVPASLTLTDGECSQIDRELQPYEDRVQQQLVDDYRSALYRGHRPRR